VFSILRRLRTLRRNKIINLAGHRIELPASHSLPAIRAKCPHYEGEISRLAEFLLKTEGRLDMVDVGANVGDTVALIRSRGHGCFLCIEGSPRFFGFLQKNVGELANVRCINALVTDPDDVSQSADFTETDGTAYVAKGRSSHAPSTVPRLTLDRILSENADFPAPNFLKIDTDGYDLNVLRGSTRLLQSSRPAIHFELSFRHWKSVGGATWKEAADLLSVSGYKECLLYDNLGYLIGVDEFECARLLPVMELYAFRRDRFYLNVVTFHCGSPHWASFKQSELLHPFDP
jgi:FkbM family methyltransferase